MLRHRSVIGQSRRLADPRSLGGLSKSASKEGRTATPYEPYDMI